MFYNLIMLFQKSNLHVLKCSILALRKICSVLTTLSGILSWLLADFNMCEETIGIYGTKTSLWHLSCYLATSPSEPIRTELKGWPTAKWCQAWARSVRNVRNNKICEDHCWCRRNYHAHSEPVKSEAGGSLIISGTHSEPIRWKWQTYIMYSH